jgi:hypothetical protein
MPSNGSCGVHAGSAPLAWPRSGSSGGTTGPAWTRPGSIADIDFVNDEPRAWDGANEIAWADFNTIFGDSELMGLTWTPEMLDPGVGLGLGEVQGTGAFIGTMLDTFNFDFTVVLEFEGIFHLEYTEPTFATDITFDANPAPAPTGKVRVSDANGDGLGRDHDAAAVELSKLGVTISAASMYAAYNGELLYLNAGAPNPTFVDPNTPNQPTDIIFGASKLKRVTVYNPVKTATELQVLTA